MEFGTQAAELARRHGWTDDPAAVLAYMTLADTLAWQVRPAEAEPWLQRAERTVRAEADPAAALPVRHARGVLDLACGRYAEALAAFRATDQLASRLAAPHMLIPAARALLVYALVRLGQAEAAGQYLARSARPAGNAWSSGSPMRRCG